MAAGWSNEATKALLTVWGEQSIQISLMALYRTKLCMRVSATVMNSRGSSVDKSKEPYASTQKYSFASQTL